VLRINEMRRFSTEPPHSLLFVHRSESRGGRTETRRWNCSRLDFSFGNNFALKRWVQTGPGPGDRLETRRLDLASEKTTTVTYVLERIDAEGHLECTVLPGNRRVRLDAQGNVVLERISDSLRARRESESKARQLGLTPDFYALGSVPVDKRLGPPGLVKELELEVHGPRFPDGPRQSVVASGEGWILRSGHRHGRPVRVVRSGLKRSQPHPRILKTAQRVVGRARAARIRVEILLNFVSQTLEDADVPKAGLTPLEILESGKGDCTEHALLFIALARAAGIPAREVHGLMYRGDREGRFSPHMWCEVALDGFWHPVDPTWNQFEIDATHISYGEHGTLPYLGRLRFRVVETVVDPE
jgi:hypothetical protein